MTPYETMIAARQRKIETVPASEIRAGDDVRHDNGVGEGARWWRVRDVWRRPLAPVGAESRVGAGYVEMIIVTDDWTNRTMMHPSERVERRHR